MAAQATVSVVANGLAPLVIAAIVRPFILNWVQGKLAVKVTILLLMLTLQSALTTGKFYQLIQIRESLVQLEVLAYKAEKLNQILIEVALGIPSILRGWKVLRGIVLILGQEPGITKLQIAVKAKSRTLVVRKGSVLGRLFQRTQ